VLFFPPNLHSIQFIRYWTYTVVRSWMCFAGLPAIHTQNKLNCVAPSIISQSLGDWSDGGTPGYIPNPAVKPVSADGTWGGAPWESRSLPRDFLENFLRWMMILSGDTMRGGAEAARQAHNLKVGRSNRPPATVSRKKPVSGFFLS
jgi:hypothetical protein